jgi:hypothetical protein
MRRPPFRQRSMSTLFRITLSLATAGIIVAGSLLVVGGGPAGDGKDFDTGFMALLALALLPTVVYAFGVRYSDTVLYFGLGLLFVTAAAWVFVFVSDDAFRGVYTPFAFFITLATSMAGAARDWRRRNTAMGDPAAPPRRLRGHVR